MEKTVYLVVTNNEYELPVIEADTLTEIAERMKLHLSTVSRAFKYGSPLSKKRYKIIESKADIEPRYVVKLKNSKVTIGHFSYQWEIAERFDVSERTVWYAIKHESAMHGKYLVQKFNVKEAAR